ncbi:MAG: HEAT repeat domain-containing protein [Spirochaetaceae bacterium]|nr:HEAT repeat domain-containing protein [Spirochaetaceae bacterium]MCF7947193.1 HEAT repeat domain-containing protein [Spirochaetia bacterium]MCF7950058.1 HEAT repeat domain-containing protein [Spirochaetaceae bacterium]
MKYTVTQRSIFRSVVLFFLLITAYSFLEAQSYTYDASRQPETQPGESVTGKSIEELYLSSTVSLDALGIQLEGGTPDQKMLAMATLENQMERNIEEGKEDDIYNILVPIVEKGVLDVTGNENSIEGYNAVARKEAVRLLGVLGTTTARDQLVLTVKYDPDPMVRAQALFGLGKIGTDDNGDVTRAIAKMLFKETLRRPPSENAVYAGILAIEQISADPLNTVDDYVREVLVDIAACGSCVRLLRNNALRVLSKM